MGLKKSGTLHEKNRYGLFKLYKKLGVATETQR